MKQNTKIILIADDDLDDQQLLEEAFQLLEQGASVHTVTSGKELMEYLLNCSTNDLPCLIVLDYNMPSMNGVEILQYLKQNEVYNDIPAVVWSTSDSQHYQALCRQNGAKHYFHKPDDFLLITEMAKKMLSFCNTKTNQTI